MAKARYVVTLKLKNYATNRYVTKQKFEYNNYDVAMAKADQLERIYFLTGIIDFKDTDPFKPGLYA